MAISLEAKIIEVKAKWPHLEYSKGFPKFWEEQFYRLTPAERALAVACSKCEAEVGCGCFEDHGITNCVPHPERIQAVEREEKFQNLATSDPEGHLQELTEEASHAAEQDDLGVASLLVKDGFIMDLPLGMEHEEEINRRIREADRRAFERGKKAGM